MRNSERVAKCEVSAAERSMRSDAAIPDLRLDIASDNNKHDTNADCRIFLNNGTKGGVKIW